MRILTAAEMREVDRLTSAQAGIPSLTLMENAGVAVAGFCARKFPRLASKRIVVLCGKGNNGGDGFVAARQLRGMGARPEVWLLAKLDEVQGDAEINRERWLACGGELRVVSSGNEWKENKASLGDSQIVVDALFGTGFRGPVEGWLAEVIDDVNSRRRRAGGDAQIVAVDMPSGLPSDAGEVTGMVVRADYTVTFTAPKRGQVSGRAADYIGDLHVGEIGSPASLVESASQSQPAWRWLEPGEFVRNGLQLRRPPDSNKGLYGHVLSIAGSRGKSGAAVLSGWAALRAGAGLVTVATAECVQSIVAAALPELMTVPLACSKSGSISRACLQQFEGLAKGKSALAIGPGLTTEQETGEVVRRIVRDCQLPIVLDADGLNAFAGRSAELSDHVAQHLVVTPHPGEMARLAACSTKEVQSNRIEIATSHAAQLNGWVILKGYQTVIAAPDGRVWINSTGNPGMATGGTGDVLTGMLAGMVAQFGTEQWISALTFGVYLHGLAGDLAAEEIGEPPLIASDLIRAIPQAWRQVQTEMDCG